jgi:hypothetical protein
LFAPFPASLFAPILFSSVSVPGSNRQHLLVVVVVGPCSVVVVGFRGRRISWW